MSEEDPAPLGAAIDDLFRRLGLPDPQVMARLVFEWEALAGEPWVRRSRPLYIRDRALVVEAASPSLVAFLKYGVGGLLATLSEELGPGVVERIEVRSPSR